jgi:hypothetical protein
VLEAATNVPLRDHAIVRLSLIAELVARDLARHKKSDGAWLAWLERRLAREWHFFQWEFPEFWGKQPASFRSAVEAAAGAGGENGRLRRRAAQSLYQARWEFFSDAGLIDPKRVTAKSLQEVTSRALKKRRNLSIARQRRAAP